MHSLVNPPARTVTHRGGRRTRALIGTAVAIAACTGALTGPAAAAPASTEVQPAALERGADSSLPFFDGSTLVAGSQRIPTRLKGRRHVLGTEADGDHLVSAERPRRTTVARVTPAGDVSVVVRFNRPARVIASPGLARVALTTSHRARTVIAVHTTDTGRQILQRGFPGHVRTLAVGPNRAILARGEGANVGTWGWNPTANRTHRISRWAGYRADITSDRLAVLEGDPYQDACQRVIRLSEPGKTVWRSCTDRVDAFSPSGFMATVHILSDGLGPNAMTLRRPGGRPVARFHTKGWFGEMTFEGPRAVVTYTAGRVHAATVRCMPIGCERVSELEPRPDY